MSRSLKQIEESLRKKLAEADNYTTAADYLASLGAKSPHRGDPVMSPDLGGGQGPGGAARSVREPAVWRRGEPPPAPMPKVWRRGEPPPASIQSTPQQQPTAQEKLTQAARAAAKETGEVIVTAKPGGLVSRMLDKFAPADKVRIEPTLSDTPQTNLGRKEPTFEQSKKEIDHLALLQDPNVQTMLNLIGRAEGADYDTIVGGKKKITDFSAHPNIVGLRTAQGPSKAAGKYQITKNTYDRYAPRLGIKDFSPESQDKIALQILHDTGALKDVLKGKFKPAVEKAGSTWMSLPSSKIIQGRGPKSWDWVAKNLKDAGTTVLATAVGATPAQAAEKPKQPVKEPEKSGSDTFLDKVKRTLPPAVGGGGELVSKVFGGDKKPTPTVTVEPTKPAPVKSEPVKAPPPQINVRKEFEKEFAKQRAALGSGGTFAWTNPLTGKTSEFTTAYKDEITKPKSDTKVSSAPTVEVPVSKAEEPDEIEKIIKTKQSEVLPDAPIPSDQDIEAAKAKSQKHLADIDRELADKGLVKESINTELQDILRLAGRI